MTKRPSDEKSFPEPISVEDRAPMMAQEILAVVDLARKQTMSKSTKAAKPLAQTAAIPLSKTVTEEAGKEKTSNPRSLSPKLNELGANAIGVPTRDMVQAPIPVPSAEQKIVVKQIPKRILWDWLNNNTIISLSEPIINKIFETFKSHWRKLSPTLNFDFSNVIVDGMEDGVAMVIILQVLADYHAKICVLFSSEFTRTLKAEEKKVFSNLVNDIFKMWATTPNLSIGITKRKS
jgi:hypothetical protein